LSRLTKEVAMRQFAPVIVGLALCGTSLVGSAVSAARPPPVAVLTRPLIAQLDQQALIIVRGFPWSRRLDVRLAGSTTSIGLLAPWQSLHFRHGVWSGELLPVGRRGVYPIQFRQRPGGHILQSRHWLFRVLARNTLKRPAFPSPFDVARWWVRVVAGGTLLRVRPWRFPTHDYRDRRLQQEFVVAYSPHRNSTVSERLGIFITCVRINFGGDWRLLEASVSP
jgi:hypothetical protein